MDNIYNLEYIEKSLREAKSEYSKIWVMCVAAGYENLHRGEKLPSWVEILANGNPIFSNDVINLALFDLNYKEA